MTSAGRAAIIGGSGTRLPPWLRNVAAVTVDTPYGPPTAPPMLGTADGHEVLYLARHGSTHQLLPHQVNYRANLWALRELGACRIAAVNAVGGITRRMLPGRIAVPNQLIDYTWGRAHTFVEQGTASPPTGTHVEFTAPYTAQERQALLVAARATGTRVLDGGVYGAVQGPRLETAAEIERLYRDGCDLVGMTGMPEAALAAELQLPYACLAVIANRAAGRSRQPLTEELMHANLRRVMADAEQLLAYWAAPSPVSA